MPAPMGNVGVRVLCLLLGLAALSSAASADSGTSNQTYFPGAARAYTAARLTATRAVPRSKHMFWIGSISLAKLLSKAGESISWRVFIPHNRASARDTGDETAA